MSAVTKRVFIVDITLFRCIFVLVSDTVSVGVTPRYSNLSPLTVRLIRFTSVLFGYIVATGLISEMLRSLDTLLNGTKNIVFVSVGIRVPTPCASLPKSFA